MKTKQNTSWSIIVIWGLLLMQGLANIAHANPPEPKPVEIAVSISIPPFFIKEKESGMEMDIIRQAFLSQGIRIAPHFFWSAPRIASYRNHQVDCASTVPLGADLEGYFSAPVITMETVAISLTEKKLSLTSVADLKNINIIAYTGAKKLLGETFAKAISDNRRYRERVKNELLPVLLYRKRVDAVLSDVSVFHYFRKKMAHRVDIEQPITIHRLFTPSHFHIICREKNTIDTFDRGLAHLRTSGAYQRIVDAYLDTPPPQDSEK